MSLIETIAREGRLPRLSIKITPVDSVETGREEVVLPIRAGSGDTPAASFLSYEFDQNMLIPVDGFSFTLAPPQDLRPYDLVRDGDVIQIFAGESLIATGIVDAVEEALDADAGEKITIRGRDLIGQLEDQTAINDTDSPIWLNKVSIRTVAQQLVVNTRLNPQRIILDQAPTGTYLFQSEPGESKLSSILRFLEPLNCLIWADAAGRLTIGRPNFFQPRRGVFYASRSERRANILSYRVVRNATQIPNSILPIFSGQELAQTAVAKQQRLLNAAQRPAQLLRCGHRVPKTVVVSHPNGADANFVNTLEVFNATRGQVQKQLVSDSSAGQALFIQQWAKREIARKNMDELMVDIDVIGHFADDGLPYLADEKWMLQLERPGINEEMYCYAVRYALEEGGSYRTTLSFCRLNTIVADSIAP